MPLSVTQLQTATTVAAALEVILDVLESEGFPARSWQEGSVNRAFVELLAQLMAASSQISNSTSAGTFNDTALGLALTLFSSSHYENDRDTGTRAKFDIEMTTASGSGPYSQGIGTVIVEDASRGLRYRNLNALTLTSAAAVEDAFEAEVIGVASNAPDATDIDTLITALAGVTVTNLSGTPTLNGADAEGDAELKVRNSSKWSSLSEAGPKETYRRWALDGDESVTRANIDDTNALGTGTVGVYIADAVAGLGAPATTAVLAYIEARKSLTDTVSVLAAVTENREIVYAATHDPTVFASSALAEAAIDAALLAYAATFPVGGINGVFPLGGVYAAANAVVGIVNVTFSLPTVDYGLNVGSVVVLTPITGVSTAITS